MADSQESSFCMPAIVYFILSCISIYIHYSANIVITQGLLFHILFTGIWIAILYLLCREDLSTIAWSIVLIPYVLGYFVFDMLLRKAVVDPSVLLKYGTPIPPGTTRGPNTASPWSFFKLSSIYK